MPLQVVVGQVRNHMIFAFQVFTLASIAFLVRNDWLLYD